MEHNKDIQAAFMDALNALKEYAKVNGNIVGKEDVAGFFKDMSLDDNKYSYKQLLFEALRCYLYNFSSLNFNAEEEHMGKTIKTIRVAEDINITEASLRSGVAISTICKTEKGNTEFSLNNIKKYSRAFDILSSEIVRLLEIEEEGYSYSELLFEVLDYYFIKHPEEKTKQKIIK